jgi:hypothetical protein
MEELVPNPSALIESMRNMGYRPATALADLIDNSITAEASEVKIEVSPADGRRPGWVRVEDDGKGMTAGELLKAMRWGGGGPLKPRAGKDLGRFGLGLKTASFSLGKRLTVVSRRNGAVNALRWDLAVVERKGKWLPLEGVDGADRQYLIETFLDSPRRNRSGTVVLITEVDKLRVDAHTPALEDSNRTALIRAITSHLGLVFHRFLEKGKLRIAYGDSMLAPWNLLGRTGDGEEPSWMKHREELGRDRIPVRTFILPHHRELTAEEHQMLGGPRGWNAHQGFLIYRSERLIVPGGWLGFTKPEEHCKLARVVIDLPNNVDEQWGLNVIKSRVSPPAILLGDIERIAKAARSDAKKRYRFHAEREAPEAGSADEAVSPSAFWKQVQGRDNVRFLVNRGHPLVESLVQSMTDPTRAEAFLHAFERLLPVAAILQQPAKSTHGLSAEPGEPELRQLLGSLKLVIAALEKIGHSAGDATKIALSSQPFCQFTTALQKFLDS